MKKLNLKKNVLQRGDIKVHSEILNDLSSGIYSSPASCIKELVNNSFDADANLVTIRVKPVQDMISVIDDGIGMNATDFDENFAWISRSNKRNNSLFSAGGRPLIGKIGIGFIAVNEICDRMEVTSSKKGENIKFTAIINFKDILSPQKGKKNSDTVIKAKYELINTDEDKSAHYTIINLVGLKASVAGVLNDKSYSSQLTKDEGKGFKGNYLKTMDELVSRKTKSFSDNNSYFQFVLDLASYIPVEYIVGGPIKGVSDKIINELVQMHKKFNFKVDLDGIYLKKPILFGPGKNGRFKYRSISKTIDLDDGQIKFKGYFFIGSEILVPRELNGVAIRLKNIPIAKRFGFDTTFLSYPHTSDQLFRNWVSGEIYVGEGLEEAMNIDRKSFRETHPHFLAFQDFLHQYLREKVFRDALVLYNEGKVVRDKLKKENKREDLKRMFNASKIKTNVTFKDKPESEAKQDDLFKVHYSKTKAEISVDEAFAKSFPSSDWDYLERVFIVFEMSFKESKGDAVKLKQLFFKKMREHFGKKA